MGYFADLLSGAGQGGGYSGQDWRPADPATSPYNLTSMLGADRFAALGFSGPFFTSSGVSSGSPEADTSGPSAGVMTPEFAQWLDSNGYRLAADFPGGSTITANLLNSSGSPVASYSYDDSGGLFDYLPALGSLAVLGTGAAGTFGASGVPSASTATGFGGVGTDASVVGAGGLDAAGLSSGFGGVGTDAGVTGFGGLDASSAGLATSAPAYGGVGTAGAGAGTDAILTGYGGSAGLTTAGTSLADLASGALKGIGGINGLGSLASIASGLYGMKLAGDARAAMDPFAPYRAGYAQKLADLEANPGSIVTRPGFQAGLDTIAHKSQSTGYYGSGNMASALSRYSGDFYTAEANRLAGLAGAGTAPGAGQQLGADLASKSLGSIGYGLGPLLSQYFQGP